MNYSIKILVLILNIAFVWSKCDITLEDADNCALEASFFGNRDAIVPTSDVEMTKHCENSKMKMDCVKQYVNQCLNGTVKQITEIALNNGAKYMERRCDNPKDRQEFLDHVKCVVAKDKMEPFHICADQNMVMGEMVLKMEGDEVVGAGCCIFHVLQDCIRQRNKEICGEATTDYWDDVINELSDESMSLSCSEYPSSEKCESVLSPKVWADIKAIEAIKDAATLASMYTHKTGIIFLVDMMKKLSQK